MFTRHIHRIGSTHILIPGEALSRLHARAAVDALCAGSLSRVEFTAQRPQIA